MKFLTLPLTKKKEKEGGAKTSNFKNIQFVIFTNYHIYHLWSDPDEDLKNKNWF